MKERGLFITLEGIDGAGKSTLSAMIKSAIESRGHNVSTTFEPTKNVIGSIIRDVLTHKIEMDENTIAALFVADRLHHLQNKEDGVLKNLNAGTHVICDRYYLSSYAYHVPFVSLDWVISANKVCADLLKPDICFFIDISVEESLKRISRGRENTDLFETEERLTMVRNNYMDAIQKVKDTENIVVINGERSEFKVFQDIWGLTEARLHPQR